MNRSIIQYLNEESGAIVSKDILSSKQKIHRAKRDKSLVSGDSGWQFVSNSDKRNTSDGQVLSTSDVLKMDPTVKNIINSPAGSDFIKKDGVWVKK